MKKLVFIADDWGYTHGGINSFNYQLCTALGENRSEDYLVYCIVPFATDNDIENASKNNIILIRLSIAHFSFPYFKSKDSSDNKGNYNEINKYAKAILPLIKVESSDKVYFIGHDIITGFLAIECKKQLKEKLENYHIMCILFHHMAYEYYQVYNYHKTPTEISEKIGIQEKLFESKEIDVAFGVGPVLTESIRYMNSKLKIYELIPGMPEIEVSAEPKTGPFKIITFGRFESDPIKNMSLAADAFGLLSKEDRKNQYVGENASLTVIGLSNIDAESKIIQERHIKTPAVFIGSEYSSDREELFSKLQRNHVCLMLSIHEGFGLVGLEAIAAGVPLVLSTNSGLFEYLNNTIPNFKGNYVKEITLDRDRELDSKEVKKILLEMAKHRETYKNRANNLRDILLKRGLIKEGLSEGEIILTGLTWKNVAKDFIQKLDPVKKNASHQIVLNNLYKDSDQIEKIFFSTNSNDYKKLKTLLNTYKIVSITGTPGLGKTLLARKLGLESLNDYDIVWFLDSGDVTGLNTLQTDAKIIDSYREFAKFLFDFLRKNSDNNSGHLTAEQYDNINILINQVKEDLKFKSWLLIFDNACDVAEKDVLEEFQKEYIPIPLKDTSLKQHILITSRNAGWHEYKGSYSKHFPLLTWDEQEIEEYFRSEPNPIYIKQYEKSNLEIFGGLPLSITLAKSFMIEEQLGIKEYKKKWDNEKDRYKLLQEKIADVKGKESIIKSVLVSFYNLKNEKQQELLKLFSFLAPDEFPLERVFKHNKNYSFISSKFEAQEDLGFPKNLLVPLTRYSLLIWLSDTSSNNEKADRTLYSIHRIVLEVIQTVQTEDEKRQNRYILIGLLNNAFEKSSFKIQFYWQLLPHISYIYSFINQNYTSVSSDKLYESLLLIYNYASFYYDIGEIKQSESILEVGRKVLEYTLANKKFEIKSRHLLTNFKIKQANILFLKGVSGESLDQSLALALEVQQESANDFLQQLQCKNELLAKIYQRQCKFEESEKQLEESKELVHKEINNQEVLSARSISPDELSGKLAGIYHNFGSLYWTRGRVGDYEKSVEYFNKSIEIQKKRIKYSTSNIQRLKDIERTLEAENAERSAIEANKDQIRTLEGNLGNQELYEHVSRMILGAVYGLMGEFHDQEYQHNKAFTYFKDIAQEKEKRRFSYTAFYMLSYGWDKKKCGKGKPDYIEQRFNEVALLKDVYKFQPTLERDEKYQVILMILKLRLAVKFKDYIEALPSAYEVLSIFSDKQKSAQAHETLWDQLRSMRYEKNKYYDVDTCSVSAFVDYAQYLKDKGDVKRFKEVKENAQSLAENMVYHRQKELDEL